VSRGFTLVELLVVVAILAALAGIVYASSGSVREKGRQTICVSNLRQIGMAIAMYRQDYGGTDTPAWGPEMGFPRSLALLVNSSRPGSGRYLTSNAAILRCPNDQDEELKTGQKSTSFMYGGGWEKGLPPLPGIPLFPERIAKRGADYPLVIDPNHNFPPKDRPAKTSYVIILRFDGRVTSGYSKGSTSWLW
jgi:prepilin-type N-terminal cleavage/methylation domain-containing protein